MTRFHPTEPSEAIGARVRCGAGPASSRYAREGPARADRSHGRQDSDRRSARVGLLTSPTLETTMQVVADRAEAPPAIQTDLRAIFVSLELSRSTWLITSLSPSGGEKMSKHSVQSEENT